MCLWFLVLLVSLFFLTFHEAQACEVPKFMTGLALVLFCRACKTFQVGGISTFAASSFLLICTSDIKGLLVEACLLLLCTFVLYEPWLGLGLPLLVFTMWQLSVLVSHEGDLGSLHFPCNLLDMSCWPLSSHISLQAGAPYLLETCPGLHCLHLWSWTQILHHTGKNQNMSLCMTFAVSGG